MKKLLIIALVLLGTGLSTQSISAAKLAPMCTGTIYNTKPCDYQICMRYIDCMGNIKRNCLLIPAGGTLSMAAFTGGCCNQILSFTIQYPGGPVSAPVVPGATVAYGPGGGIPGPCAAILDYTLLPDLYIN
jgi:hypothetical protein